MCTLPLHQPDEVLSPSSEELRAGDNIASYDESRELLDILNGVEDDGIGFKAAVDHDDTIEVTALLAESERQGQMHGTREKFGTRTLEDPESLVFGGVNPSMPSPSTLYEISGSGETEDHPEDDGKSEDKKRRNREAARQSRAKKKRMMQNIEETQSILEREKLDLRKENDALRMMNQALERQVAFFQSVFRSTFNSRAPLIPDSTCIPDKDAAWHDGSNPIAEVSSVPSARTVGAKGRVSGTKGSSMAMGIAFVAFVTLGKVTDLDAVLPNMELVAISSAEHFAVSRHVGRMLLSLDPEAEEDTQVALLVAVVLSTVISAWMVYRAGKWLVHREGWRKLLLPKHHQS